MKIKTGKKIHTFEEIYFHHNGYCFSHIFTIKNDLPKNKIHIDLDRGEIDDLIKCLLNVRDGIEVG